MEDYGYKYVRKMAPVITTLKSKEKCPIDLIPKIVRNSDFFLFCTASCYENTENPSAILETDFGSRSTIYDLGKGISPHYTGRIWKCFTFSEKASNINDNGWTRWDHPWQFSTISVDQTYTTMDAITKGLVFKASTQIFRDNTLYFFIKTFRSDWIWRANERW